MTPRFTLRVFSLLFLLAFASSFVSVAHAQSSRSEEDGYVRRDDYGSQGQNRDGYSGDRSGSYGRDAAPERSNSEESYGSGSTYNSGPPVRDQYGDTPAPEQERYGEYDRRDPPQYGDQPGAPYESYREPDARAPQSGEGDGALGTYSQNEINSAGHKFFGSISRGLANAIEYVFQKSGRPNGYILGEDAGGAFIAGLRYGEGYLYTQNAGTHKVYWQGPTVGYDVGAEGSKTMVLVYNLHHPSDIFHRYGGVQGSAYLIGGVSVQIQSYEHVTLAPIRSGVGLRLGANVGYLKYTRRPTWNPF